MREKAIIIDLDGTLANCEHRRKFLSEDPADWKSFNESMVEDTVNQWCKTLIQKMYVDHTIIIVTGRGTDFKAHTEEWLSKNSIIYEKIFMRPAGDYRADEIIKKEIYDNNIKDFYDVVFVVDDRKKVVKMWREIGLVCLQCCEGEY